MLLFVFAPHKFVLITNNIPINGSFTLAESGSETNTNSLKPNCQSVSVCMNSFIQAIYLSLSVLDSGCVYTLPDTNSYTNSCTIPIIYRKATLGPIPMVILMERYNEILNYLYRYLESTVVVQGTWTRAEAPDNLCNSSEAKSRGFRFRSRSSHRQPRLRCCPGSRTASSCARPCTVWRRQAESPSAMPFCIQII